MEDARPCRDIPSSTSREAAGVGAFGFCAGNSADLARFVARLAPEPVCDLCIAQKRSLEDVALASHASHELAGSHGFEPFQGVQPWRSGRHGDPPPLTGITPDATAGYAPSPIANGLLRSSAGIFPLPTYQAAKTSSLTD